MEEWLQHPQTTKPGTAMPELNVPERDARDIASYLATLKMMFASRCALELR
jgi:cytochrome c1